MKKELGCFVVGVKEEDLNTAMERKRAETARNTYRETHPQE